jgi:predicted MFS family arabinose efflux permease
MNGLEKNTFTQALDYLHKATVPQVFREALGDRSFVLLICGFLVSGFHVAFINLHLPSYLQDGGLDRPSAGWVIATIGLFNISGSIAVGWLCGRYLNRYVLSSIYFLRALAIAAFLLMPLSPVSALLFAAAMGILWISPVTPVAPAMGILWISPVTPVAGIITRMFGTQNLAALFGLAYFFHQVGAFLGVWLGGLVFARTGSYNSVWRTLVIAALASSLLALLVRERPRAA